MGLASLVSSNIGSRDVPGSDGLPVPAVDYREDESRYHVREFSASCRAQRESCGRNLVGLPKVTQTCGVSTQLRKSDNFFQIVQSSASLEGGWS